jgi:hypothetical protein
VRGLASQHRNGGLGKATMQRNEKWSCLSWNRGHCDTELVACVAAGRGIWTHAAGWLGQLLVRVASVYCGILLLLSADALNKRQLNWAVPAWLAGCLCQQDVTI